LLRLRAGAGRVLTRQTRSPYTSAADLSPVLRSLPSLAATPLSTSGNIWPSTGHDDRLCPRRTAAQIFHVRDGKVTEAWTQHADLYTVDEFWS
jgi:hypothetical protein